MSDLNVVTGAFGFTGAAIAGRLLEMGKHIRTLTGHPNRPQPFGDEVDVAPLAFADPDELTHSLQGATTLYNTYWIRFERGPVTFEKAVANSKTLIKAAEDAGVLRIVHISITNPSKDSPLPYFRGKALVEEAIQESSLAYAIVRPTVIFGAESILLNNIAWLLRRLPVFGVPGAGDYRLQPVAVEDVADLAIRAAALEDNLTIDAAGPDTYSFDELVRLIAGAVGSSSKIMHINPSMAHAAGQAISAKVGDVVITRDEIEGLMANLLVSNGPPTGQRRFSDWLNQSGASLGLHYMSEIERHYL